MLWSVTKPNQIKKEQKSKKPDQSIGSKNNSAYNKKKTLKWINTSNQLTDAVTTKPPAADLHAFTSHSSLNWRDEYVWLLFLHARHGPYPITIAKIRCKYQLNLKLELIFLLQLRKACWLPHFLQHQALLYDLHLL